MIGTERTLRYRTPDVGEEIPDVGELLCVERTGTTYLIVKATLTKTVVEPFDCGDLGPVLSSVHHLSLRVVRIAPGDVDTAETKVWPMVWDRRPRRRR